MILYIHGASKARRVFIPIYQCNLHLLSVVNGFRAMTDTGIGSVGTDTKP